MFTLEKKKKELLNRLQDFPFEISEVPQIIYHYCSMSAFRQIVSDGYLISTHNSGLDDDSDPRLFFNLLMNEISRKMNSRRYEAFLNILRTFHLGLTDYFITSFSKSPNEPLLWDNCGDKGRGVAIGFYANSFNVKNQIPNNKNSITRTGILSVEYITEDLDKLAESLLKYLENNEISEYLYAIDRFILVNKHVRYKSEKEVRIVELCDLRNPRLIENEDYDFLVRREKSVLTRKLAFKRYKEESFTLNSLWLGPNNRTDVNSIKAFLRSNGIQVKNAIYENLPSNGVLIHQNS